MPGRLRNVALLSIALLALGGCAVGHRAHPAADALAVRALASQYAWGVDTLDRALLQHTFARDARAHYLAVGPNPMDLDEELDGFEAIYGWLHENLGHREGTEGLPMHFVSNELVELRGNEASLQFYMHNRASSVGGVYYVEAARTRAGWRITRLRLEEQTWNPAAYADDEHAQRFFAPKEAGGRK